MREMRAIAVVAAACVAVVGLSIRASAAGGSKSKPGAYAPHIDPAEFQTVVDNPFFPLAPGTRFQYSERSDGKTLDNEITVTRDTKVIMGVTCVVVHDVVKDHDKVLEDTYDWYAQDKRGNVWYFGEDTKEFLPHGRVSTEGSWEAGVGRNRPGIMMPADPKPGEPYRQEYGPGHAEDMGQVEAVGDSVTVPSGSFRGCVRIKEWSLLEAGTARKWYASGVGLVREGSPSKDGSVLIAVTQP